MQELVFFPRTPVLVLSEEISQIAIRRLETRGGALDVAGGALAGSRLVSDERGEGLD